MEWEATVCDSTFVIDIGGGHIGLALPVWTGTGVQILPYTTWVEPFPTEGTQEDVQQVIDRLMQAALVESESHAEAHAANELIVAICTPGPINCQTQEIGYTPNAPQLRGMKIGKGIKDYGGIGRVILMKDAAAHGNGVFHMPIAQETNEAWVVAWGSGIATSLRTQGKMVEGLRGNVAEGGHFPFRRREEDPLLPCECGEMGCVEAYTGAKLVKAYVEKRLEALPATTFTQLRERGTTIKDVIDAASEGDPFASGIFDLVARAFADLMITLTKATNPEKIFLCGGVANAGEFLLTSIKERMSDTDFVRSLYIPELVKVDVPDSTAYLGLAYRAIESTPAPVAR